MNLEKYFDNVSPLSPPQSSHSSTDVATNSSIASPESETPFMTSSLLNHAMGEEFVIPEDRLLRNEYIRNGPFQLKLPNDSYLKTSFHGKMRTFQAKWYISRPWLEYNRYDDLALCFSCRVFGSAQNKYDSTFVKDGFRQLPHAIEKNRGFDEHSKSEIHSISMEKWISYLHDKITSSYPYYALEICHTSINSPCL